MDSENTKQIKYHAQPESTLEKIYSEIEKLYQIDNNLYDILACSGRDSETEYTRGYLDMLGDMEGLRKALHSLLDNYNAEITDLEFEVSEIKGMFRAKKALSEKELRSFLLDRNKKT